MKDKNIYVYQDAWGVILFRVDDEGNWIDL